MWSNFDDFDVILKKFCFFSTLAAAFFCFWSFHSRSKETVSPSFKVRKPWALMADLNRQIIIWSNFEKCTKLLWFDFAWFWRKKCKKLSVFQNFIFVVLMDEDILRAISGGDEAETLLGVEKFDGSLGSHLKIFLSSFL